jgi:hypothetical protein
MRPDEARAKLSALFAQGEAADPRDLAAAHAAIYGPQDALVTEAIRHGWLVKRGESLDSCYCLRCEANR